MLRAGEFHDLRGREHERLAAADGLSCVNEAAGRGGVPAARLPVSEEQGFVVNVPPVAGALTETNPSSRMVWRSSQGPT